MKNEITVSQAELLINANLSIFLSDGIKKDDAILKIKEIARLAINHNKEFIENVKWTIAEIKKHDRLNK